MNISKIFGGVAVSGAVAAALYFLGLALAINPEAGFADWVVYQSDMERVAPVLFGLSIALLLGVALIASGTVGAVAGRRRVADLTAAGDLRIARR